MLLSSFQNLRRFVAAGAALIALAGLANRASAETESEVKATYLLWFAQHAIWRDEDFPTRDSPLIIVILGQSPFEQKEIEKIKAGPVQKHRVEIRYSDDAGAVPVCHILFVSKSERRRLAQTLKPFREKRILTISDVEEFTQEGGVASVVIKQFGPSSFKPVPDINKEAATRCRLEFTPDVYMAVKTLQARYR